MQLAANLTCTYLLVNYFAPGDFGAYKLVASLSAAFVVVLMCGLNIANVRYFPEYLSNQNYIARQLYVFAILQIGIWLAFIIFVDIVDFDSYFNLDERVSIWMVVVLTLFAYLKAYFGESLHVAFQRRTRLTQIRLLLYIIQLSSVAWFVLYVTGDVVDFVKLIVLLAALEFLILGTSSAQIIFKAPSDQSINSSGGPNWREVFHFSIGQYGFSVVNFLRDQAFSIILLATLFSIAEVGFYAVALIVPTLVKNFTPSKVFGGLLIPALVGQWSAEKPSSDFHSALRFLNKINLVILVPSIMLCVALLEDIITVAFGEEYTSQTFLIAVPLLLTVIVYGLIDIYVIDLTVQKRSKILFYTNLSSVAHLFFVYAFSDFGVVVAGISTLVSGFITVTICSIVGARIGSENYMVDLLNFKLIGFAVILEVCIFAISTFGFEVRILCSVVLFLAFVAGVFFSSYFSVSEREKIANSVPTYFKRKFF